MPPDCFRYCHRTVYCIAFKDGKVWAYDATQKVEDGATIWTNPTSGRMQFSAEETARERDLCKRWLKVSTDEDGTDNAFKEAVEKVIFAAINVRAAIAECPEEAEYLLWKFEKELS